MDDDFQQTAEVEWDGFARCFCGILARKQTCWDKANPGRRKWVCAANRGVCCHYDMWAEPKHEPRAAAAMNRLVARNNKLSRIIYELRRQEWIKVVVIGGLCCLVLWLVARRI